MNRPSRWEREAARATSEVARRAIWRLDVLEWVIIVAAAGLVIAGGALVALLISDPSGLGFRATWVGTSLLLLVVPGAIMLPRMRKDERMGEVGTGGLREGDDG